MHINSIKSTLCIALRNISTSALLEKVVEIIVIISFMYFIGYIVGKNVKNVRKKQ